MKQKDGSNYYYYSATQRRASYLRPQPAPRRSLVPRVLAVVVVIAALAGVVSVFRGNHAQANPPATTKSPAVAPVDTTAMSARINELIAAHPELDISVAVADLSSGHSQHYGVDKPYIAASTAKLLTASLFLSRVEQGRAGLGDMVGSKVAKTQLKLLIEESDNDAWQAFNDLLSHRTLAAYAKSLGMQHYDADENTVTSKDIALLLQKLYKNELLNKQHTSLLLSYMRNAGEHQYIPAAVPSGVKVYHKAGYLDDRAHDAAIIDDSKHPYVLVIFTKSHADYDFAVGITLMHQMTDATVETYIR